MHMLLHPFNNFFLFKMQMKPRKRVISNDPTVTIVEDVQRATAQPEINIDKEAITTGKFVKHYKNLESKY